MLITGQGRMPVMDSTASSLHWIGTMELFPKLTRSPEAPPKKMGKSAESTTVVLSKAKREKDGPNFWPDFFVLSSHPISVSA
jgi:hypothetical protein